MATAVASTRAIVRSAPKIVLPLNHGLKGKKLIDEMHAKLYPHLYTQSRRRPRSIAPIEAEKKAENAISESMEALSVSESRAVKPARVRGADTKSKASIVRRDLEDTDTQSQARKARTHTSGIPIRPSKPSIRKACPDPIATVTSSQIALLDPTGSRTRLFAKSNPECARVGDVLLVRQRTGDPFAGVCINIRRRGVDTAILLRGQLTRVGVEVWYKVYSPLVEGIEVVQRAAKRARRARLTYMRTPKHDRGSVENTVRVYLRQKAALGTAAGKKGLGGAGGAMGGKRGGKKGKKR